MAGLIFTIAQNGYGTAFLKCIASQRAYARRIGAQFVVVDKPARVSDTALSAWLKIPLMLNGLKSGYDWVMYIDADCEVSDRAPDFRTELDGAEGDVFMALGRSGRVNSGVMIARQSAAAVSFFTRVLESATGAVPEEDRKTLKYENGNVIFVNRVHGGVTTLDPRWNNATDPKMRDYIRHYTGDMRKQLRRGPWRELQYRVMKRFGARQLSTFQSQPERREDAFFESLRAVEDEAVRSLPALRLGGRGA